MTLPVMGLNVSSGLFTCEKWCHFLITQVFLGKYYRERLKRGIYLPDRFSLRKTFNMKLDEKFNEVDTPLHNNILYKH